MNGRHLLFVFAFLSALCLTSACQNEDSFEHTNSLRIQVPNPPDILNPILSRTDVSRQIETLMYLPLAIYNGDENQWIPVLTKHYEVESLNDGGVIYRMTMHPDARWSDGELIKIDDVLFTLKMSLNPYLESHSWAAYVELIDTVRVIQDEMIIKMNDPYILADEFIASFQPLPKHVLDPDGVMDDLSFLEMKNMSSLDPEKREILKQLSVFFNDYGKVNQGSIVVSGPYMVSSWSTDQALRLRRLESFWGDMDSQLEELFSGGIDTIQYVFISDLQNALNAFANGHIDLIQSLTEKDSGLIMNSGGEIIPVPTYQMFYISLNHRKPLLEQRRIRRGLSLMIDRKDMIQKLFHGKGQRAEGPIHPEKSYFTSFSDGFDPEKALAIFEEMGCERRAGVLHCPIKQEMIPMRFHLWTTQSSLSRQVATLLKSYWRKAGIDLIIQSADFRTFLPELQNKTFDMAALALRQNNILDDPYPLWHSSQSGQTGKNYQGMAIDSVDAILEELRRSVDPESQNILYKKLQEQFYLEEPVLFLVAPHDVIGVNAQVDLYRIKEKPGFDLLRTKWKR